MMKNFRKAISMLICVAMLVSLVPASVLAEGENLVVSDVIRLSNWAHTQKGKSYAQGPYYHSSLRDYGIKLQNGAFSGYSQLDLTGYEEILENEGTTVSVNLVSTASNTYNMKNFAVYAMDDTTDFYATEYDSAAAPLFEGDEGVRMTDAQAIAAGLQNYENKGICLNVRSDASGAATYTFNADPTALATQLKTGKDNSVVTFSYKAIPHDSTLTGGKVVGYIFYTDPLNGVTITYDKSKIDNQSYVNTLAQEFSWADVSTQDINALENSLTLPTKYKGADVTWTSSDNSRISSNGTVTLKGPEKTVTLTATLTYKGIEETAQTGTATKDFVVTLVSETPVTKIVPFENCAHHSTSSSALSSTGKPNVPSGKPSLYYIQVSGSRKGYAQLNLSPYEEILRNENTTLELSFYTGNSFGSTSAVHDFKVILLPDSADVDNLKALTGSQAKAYGMWDDTDRPVLYERTDTTKLTGQNTITTQVDKQTLLNVLDESYTNGKVTVGFFPCTSGSSNSAINLSQSVGLKITYYPLESDDAAFFEENKTNLMWENLTKDSATDLTNDLPSYFRGGEISWASSDGTVKNDGSLYGSKTEKVSDKITATYTYAGNSFTKEFDVTLAIYLPVTITVESTTEDSTYVYSKQPDEAVGVYSKAYDEFVTENTGVFQKDGDSVKSDRMIFLRWDLSDYEEILDVATDVSVDWTNRDGNYSTGEPKFAFTVMNNVNDTWHNSDLTYRTAVETGMRTDAGVYSVNNITLVKNMSISDDGLLDAFKAALSQNPENSIVSAKLTAATWNPMNIRSNSRTYDLKITYYPRDVEEKADSFIAEKFNNMPWEAISFQDIGCVVADLDLPKSIYGSDVTWASSDEDAIVASTGEVIIGNEAKTVDLTATCAGATKTFTVTVPANGMATKSTTMRSNGLACSGNTTEAHIYANDDVAGTPDVIVASYVNGELANIRIHENATIKAGFNCFYSNLTALEPAGLVTKAIVVDDITTLKPLCVAK